MRELGDDVTHGQTYRQTQPFIVKDEDDFACSCQRLSATGFGFHQQHIFIINVCNFISPPHHHTKLI